MRLPQGQVLEPGMQGPYVRLLQFELQLLGEEISDEEVLSNTLGPDTEQAVVRLQEELRLENMTPGVVDQQIAEGLNRLVREAIPVERVVGQLSLALENYGAQIDDLDEGSPDLRTEVKRLGDAVHALSIVHEDLGRDADPDAVEQMGHLLESMQARLRELGEQIDEGDQEERFAVHGRVVSHEHRGLEGLRVLLVDKCVGEDAALGETTTGAGGRYDIQYSLASVQEQGKDEPDLQVQIPIESDDDVLSHVLYNAGPDERIDVIVPSGRLPRVAELTQLQEALTGQCGGFNLSQLREDDERQDITYLANKTGWDARMVAMTALAEQFGQESDIEPEFFYALFRAGLPANETALSHTDPETVVGIWEQATDEAIIHEGLKDRIPQNLERFKEYGIGRLLEAPASVGVSSFGELVNLSLGDDDARKQRVAELYYENQNNLGEFWEGVRNELGPEVADRLQLDGRLAYLTVNNAPLIRRLHESDVEPRTPLDLVRNGLYQPDSWIQKGLLDDGVPLPEEIPGQDADEKKRNYADYMASYLRQSYPTFVTAEMINHDEIPLSADPQVKADVYQFLSGQQGRFELGMQAVEQYLQRQEIELNGEALAQVKNVQRLYQFSPSFENMGWLAANKFDSAYAVTQYAEQEFVHNFKDEMGGEATARLTYVRAHQIYNFSVNIATGYSLDRSAPPVYAISGSPNPNGGAGSVNGDGGNGAAGAAPSVPDNARGGDERGGSISAAGSPGVLDDPTGRDEGGSNDADGPASSVLAYPTLEQIFGEMDYCACEHCRSWLSPAAYLVDLLMSIDGKRYNSEGKELPATHTKEIPLEVLLERRPDIQHIQLTCENTNTVLPYIDLVNEILEYFVVNGIDEEPGNFSLEGFEGHNIEAGVTTDELTANPQFVEQGAYDHLRQKAVFPPILPFHRSLEGLRRYFDHFEVALHAAMEPLRINDNLDRAGEPDEAEYAWRDILMERLGLSRQEHAILTYSSPELEKLDVSFRTIRDFRDGALDEAAFRARLPGDLDETAFGGDVARWVTDHFDDFVPLQKLYGEDPAAFTEDDLAGRLRVVDMPELRPVGISNVKLFTRKLGISYEDLIEIVRTRFINPYSHLIPKLERLGVSFGTIRDFHEDVLDDDKFTARLREDLKESAYGGDVPAWIENNYERIMRLIVLSDPTGSEDICSFEQFEMRYALPHDVDRIEVGWTPKSVNHEWSDVNFKSTFSSPPVVLASMQTSEGTDPAGTRLQNRTHSSFEVKVEEEQSSDPEIKHAEEQVGYLAVAPGAIRDAGGTLIGEAGIRETGQPGEDGSAWHTVNLENGYTNPVVIMQVMSSEEEDPAHTRIQSVGSGSFEFQIEEWEYQDQTHGVEQMGYVVLEQGRHRLADGTTIEVGTVDTDHNWATVSFEEGFLVTPAVVSHCQTVKGGDAVVTRQQEVTREGLKLRVQEEGRGAHRRETVGYVAVLPVAVPFDKNRLQPVEFLKLLRFIRLWKKLGWGIQNTDRAITALYPAQQVPEPQDDEATAKTKLDEGFDVLTFRLAHVKRVMEALDLNPRRDLLPLLALWSPIDTHGSRSLYHQMFLNPTILELDDVFEEDGYGSYLADKRAYQEPGAEPPKLLAHAEALRAAFNLTQEEWALILEALNYDDSTGLTLENISAIFRHGYLARQLGLSVRELLALRSLSGIDPFDSLEPVNPAILRFIELAQLIDQSPFGISQLLYFLDHEDLGGNASPDRDSVLDFARRLREDLVRVDREHRVEDDPNGEIAREKMALVYGDEVADTFFGLLNHTSRFAVDGYHHEEEELEDDILAVTDRIAYDNFRKQLSFRGVMSESVKTALQGVPGISPEFESAIDTLFEAGQNEVETFFDKYPDLEAPFEDYQADNKMDMFLETFLPTLRQKLKRQQIRETVSSQVDTPLPLASTLLETPLLLHAAGPSDDPAIVDFLNLETSGVSAQYVFDGGASEQEVVAPNINYHPDGTALPENPASPDAPVDGVWRWYLEAPDNGFYNFYVEAGASTEEIFLRLDGERVDLASSEDTLHNEEAIELEAGRLYEMQLRATNVKDKLVLKWGSKGLAREPIPPAHLYPAGPIERFTNTYLRFLKAITIAEELELGAAEIEHFGTHEDYIVNGEGWLNALPASRSLTLVGTTRALLESFTTLLRYARLKETLRVRDERLIGLFENPLLFSVGPEFQGDLTAGDLSDRFREAFAEEGILLSPDDHVTIATDIEGGLWRIEDRGEEDSHSQRTYNVIKIGEGGSLSVYEKGGLLERVTGWKAANLRALLGRIGLEMSDLGHLHHFLRVKEAFDLLEKLGIRAETLLESTTNEPSPDLVRNLQGALRARYDEDAWLEVLRPINDELRELQRDALVAFVLHELGQAPETAHIDTPDKLFEYFLIDVQMDPCMISSRIKQAISTVQLFVQRCLMSLEPKVASSSINAKRWEWMKRYRIWEANRKIYLYPENWLEPELRDNKSPFFEDFESELLESDITDEAATTALLHYLEKLDEVAKLEICGMYFQEEDSANEIDEVVHVVARTAGAGRKYYYRRLEHSSWTPWEQIGLNIEDNPVLPVVWRGRLLLFWLTVMQKGPEGQKLPVSSDKSGEDIAKLTPEDSEGDVEVQVEVTLNWSEYYNGKWQPAKTSDVNRPVSFGDISAAGEYTFDRTLMYMRSVILSGGGTLEISVDYVGPRIPSNGEPKRRGLFVLYNRHGLPEVEPDVPIYDYPDQPKTRDFDKDELALVVQYRSRGNPTTEHIILDDALRYVFIEQQKEPMHIVKDVFVAPFFFQDKRHVFFVRVAESPGLAEAPDAINIGILEEYEEPRGIPRGIRIEPHRDGLLLPEESVFMPLDTVSDAVDTGLIESVLRRHRNINRGMNTGNTVLFGGIEIGLGGSTIRTGR